MLKFNVLIIMIQRLQLKKKLTSPSPRPPLHENSSTGSRVPARVPPTPSLRRPSRSPQFGGGPGGARRRPSPNVPQAARPAPAPARRPPASQRPFLLCPSRAAPGAGWAGQWPGPVRSAPRGRVPSEAPRPQGRSSDSELGPPRPVLRREGAPGTRILGCDTHKRLDAPPG